MHLAIPDENPLGIPSGIYPGFFSVIHPGILAAISLVISAGIPSKYPAGIYQTIAAKNPLGISLRFFQEFLEIFPQELKKKCVDSS